MLYKLKNLSGKSLDRINQILNNETKLINTHVNMIGSGNYPFKNVLKALNTPMAINPAEGFPNKRYFPGCKNLDELELYGNQVARNFFNTNEEYNVSLQPHSGTQANHIVFNALFNRNKEQYILAMDSKAGGHVSHNFYPNTFFKSITYSVDENDVIDYLEIEKLCQKYKPVLIIGGASSYPVAVDYKKLSDIARNNNTLLLADISHSAIFVSAGLHMSPFGYADFITMTTNKTTRGARGGLVFYKNDYSKIIEDSVFPLTQGSPKYNEILSKVIMFLEMEKFDKIKYANSVLDLSSNLAHAFLEKGLKIYTGSTKSHLVVLDLTKLGHSGYDIEKRLEKVNILANRNCIPRDPKPALEASGIRFGTLSLATINISQDDFQRLIEIIVDVVINNNLIYKDEVMSIMSKYELNS